MPKEQYRLKIKDLPFSERPYERLEKYGSEMLSDAELLAIIIKTGSKSDTSVALAQKILNQDHGENGLAFLYDISLEQLRAVKGIGRVKAIQLKAVIELSKRISASGLGNRMVVKSPEDICRLLMDEMRYLKKEIFIVVLLSTKNHVLKKVNVSIGSLSASIVHPREAFTEAVKAGASGVIFVHNHPSGDPDPSSDDIETTIRLCKAGDILGIKVLDHIIIGDGRYISLKEKGHL